MRLNCELCHVTDCRWGLKPNGADLYAKQIYPPIHKIRDT
uniref:Uncharacterized protein n=1 Tax=Aeromonas salmonicida subsp. salmonicida TaxID=29491 RepID=A0A1I9S1Z1_AERSS|nr:putative hypothetical protein [Aeromonas salmonicida subsp. salmonicida]